MFIAFVICQFFYNQLNELYKIFSINEGKSEFPARRILRINVIMMIVFASFMVIGMLIFYSGKYGNIFQTISAGLMAVLKAILWALLKLLGRGPDSSTIYEEETTTTQAEFGTNEDLFVPQNNALANALMEVVAITAIIGVFIWIIYAIVKLSLIHI